jgi:hypothetical protein
LSYYLELGFSPINQTLIENVCKVSPGEKISYNFSRSTVNKNYFFKLIGNRFEAQNTENMFSTEMFEFSIRESIILQRLSLNWKMKNLLRKIFTISKSSNKVIKDDIMFKKLEEKSLEKLLSCVLRDLKDKKMIIKPKSIEEYKKCILTDVDQLDLKLTFEQEIIAKGMGAIAKLHLNPKRKGSL